MIDTVIFDMDGLLVNSEPLWVEAMQEVMSSVGVELTPDLAMKTTGLRTVEVVDYWYDHFRWNHKSKEQVADEIIEGVKERVLQQGVLMEGVAYILEFFRSRKVKLGLASSSPMEFIDHILDHFQLKGQFQAISSAEFEPYGKPHPAVYLSCAKDLGSFAAQCLAFEDSVNGMVAAKAARMKVVAVPEPHNQGNPRFALADLKLNSLLEFGEGELARLKM
jgi:mannitol-1-/sugar-/sorbitol-6-/2-deoxyglucose-6-phosphatase